MFVKFENDSVCMILLYMGYCPKNVEFVANEPRTGRQTSFMLRYGRSQEMSRASFSKKPVKRALSASIVSPSFAVNGTKAGDGPERRLPAKVDRMNRMMGSTQTSAYKPMIAVPGHSERPLNNPPSPESRRMLLQKIAAHSEPQSHVSQTMSNVRAASQASKNAFHDGAASSPNSKSAYRQFGMRLPSRGRIPTGTTSRQAVSSPQVTGRSVADGGDDVDMAYQTLVGEDNDPEGAYSEEDEHTYRDRQFPPEGERRARPQTRPKIEPSVIQLPQRVQTPDIMGVVQRLDGMRALSSSVGASLSSKQPLRVNRPASNVTAMGGGGGGNSPDGAAAGGPVAPDARTKNSLRDQEMLAFACRRAGKSRQEGIQHYRRGITYDNSQSYAKAIDSYMAFLTSCRRCGDVVGEAMACNHIGVDYMLLNPPKYQSAINYHSKHCDLADVAGKFVAHCNLGLCHKELGALDASQLHFRHALRYAVHLSHIEGESFAYGNLGVTGYATGDLNMARACIERHLQLSATLKDTRGASTAYSQLGSLATRSGDFEEAADLFESSMKLASRIGEEDSANMAKCQLGMALGNMQMDDYLRNVAKVMHGGTMFGDSNVDDEEEEDEYAFYDDEESEEDELSQSHEITA